MSKKGIRFSFSEDAIHFVFSNFGQRLRYYRKQMGLTQKELAKRCDISESTVRNYELGNRYPDHDTLTDLASELEISYYALSHNFDPSEIYGILSYFFELEKLYGISPVEVDGRMTLQFDYELCKEFDSSGEAIIERLLQVWCKFSEAFRNGEIDEKTYLAWQSKFPVFASADPEDIIDITGDAELDANLSNPKKKSRRNKKTSNK